MIQRLGDLPCGTKGVIKQVRTDHQPELTQRLMELGFLLGAEVRIVHEAPLTKDPIAVEVRGSLIALRRSEANFVEVQC